MAADPNCEECKGTGKIMTEGLILGRTRYDKEQKAIVTDCIGNGIFTKTVCYCLSDND